MLKHPGDATRLLYVGPLFGRGEFARVGASLLPHLAERFEVSALATDYRDDPHGFPFHVWGASDGTGCSRLWEIVRKTKADAILAIGLPWTVSPLLWEGIAKPMYAWTAVPATNLSIEFARRMDRFQAVGVPSAFAAEVFGESGTTASTFVAPPAIDPRLYHPVDRIEARERTGIRDCLPDDAMIIGNVSTNEPWSRLDLLVEAFAIAVKEKPLYLYIQDGNRSGGCDVKQLADHYGVAEHLVIPKPGKVPAVESMRWIYGSFDAQVTTSLGEPIGLSILEGAACGVPQIVPQGVQALFGDVPIGRLVKTVGQEVMPGGPNLIGRVVDPWDLSLAMREPARAPAQLPGRDWSRTAETIAREIEGSAARRSAA